MMLNFAALLCVVEVHRTIVVREKSLLLPLQPPRHWCVAVAYLSSASIICMIPSLGMGNRNAPMSRWLKGGGRLFLSMIVLPVLFSRLKHVRNSLEQVSRLYYIIVLQRVKSVYWYYNTICLGDESALHQEIDLVFRGKVKNIME